MKSPHIGKLIGASLGPGDPDLITRRAWAALNSGARWAYPVKKAEETSYALEIVRRGGLDVPHDAEALVFPMTRQAEPLARAWAHAASRTAEILAEGRDVVFLVEGDASTYATFAHLARTVRELAPGVEIETIPGVSSFAAAAAHLGEPLAGEDDTLAVIPAAYGVEVIDHLIDEFDTLVLLKVKPLLDEVIALLERRGLLNEACLIEKVGSPHERVVRDVSTLRGEKVAYLSLMLVRNPGRVRGELQRGCRKKIEPKPENIMSQYLPFASERIAVVSITRHGIALAGRVVACLPGARLFVPEKFRAEAEAAAPGAASCYVGKTGDQIPALFENFDGIVAIVSLGAMVRLMAPHLKDKEQDPGMVVLDEAGRFVIPVLAGHLGGANALAGHIARELGALPVLTTASDARETLAVDLLGRELGWTFVASKQVIVRASAAVVNDDPVAVVQEVGSRDWWAQHANGRSKPLPANIQLLTNIEDIDPSRYGAVLWITQRTPDDLPAALYEGIRDRLVVYTPPQEAI